MVFARRMESSRSKAELAGQAAAKALADADRAKMVAKDVELKERHETLLRGIIRLSSIQCIGPQRCANLRSCALEMLLLTYYS